MLTKKHFRVIHRGDSFFVQWWSLLLGWSEYSISFEELEEAKTFRDTLIEKEERYHGKIRVIA